MPHESEQLQLTWSRWAFGIHLNVLKLAGSHASFQIERRQNLSDSIDLGSTQTPTRTSSSSPYRISSPLGRHLQTSYYSLLASVPGRHRIITWRIMSSFAQESSPEWPSRIGWIVIFSEVICGKRQKGRWWKRRGEVWAMKAWSWWLWNLREWNPS